MKVAISAEGRNLDTKVSPVFGRCQCFIFADVKNGEIIGTDCLENSATSRSSGAGTAAAQIIGDRSTDVLISGSIGPKAYSALKQWDIKVYQGEPGTVRENIDKLTTGKLPEVDSATVSAHMGFGEKDD